MTTRLISKKKQVVKSRKLARDDWIAAARGALIEGGIEAVKVDLIAKSLGVTRGGFYWHFSDRADLLRGLLQYWKDVNTEPLLRAIEAAGARGLREDFNTTVGRFWTEEKEFSPSFDTAVRSWAHADTLVATAVREVDERRIAAFQTMFQRYGYTEDVALVRARITYFHQIGYYTLSIQETLAQRQKLFKLYDEILIY